MYLLTGSDDSCPLKNSYVLIILGLPLLQCTQTSIEPGRGLCWGIIQSVANIFSWYKEAFSVDRNKYFHMFAKCECNIKLLKQSNIWIEYSQFRYEYWIYIRTYSHQNWYWNIFKCIEILNICHTLTLCVENICWMDYLKL